MQIKFALMQIVLMLLTVGCQFPVNDVQAENTDKKPAVSQQLIIKFKPGTIKCDANGIAQLSAVIKTPIEYVRTMSGPACVIRQFEDKKDGFVQGQKLLRQHPDVEWLELDAVRKVF